MHRSVTAPFAPSPVLAGRVMLLLGVLVWGAATPAPAIAQSMGPYPSPDAVRQAELAGVRELRALLANGDPAAADSLASDALAKPAESTRTDSLLRMDLLSVLVEARLRGRRADEASTLSLAKQLVELERSLLTSRGPERATVLDLLGKALMVTGDTAGTRRCFEEALRIRVGVLGPAHPATARSYCNLGLHCFRIGDFLRSRDLYLRALAIEEGDPGREPAELAATLHNLAQLGAILGDSSRVRERFGRALELWEQLHGPGHCQVAVALHNRGAWKRGMGEAAGAALDLDRALAIRERCAAGQPSLAETLRERACVYLDAEGDAAADSLLRRAVVLFDEAYGASSIEVASCMMLLGQVAQSAGRYAEARERYDTALRALEKPPVRDSLTLADCLLSRASVAQQTEESAVAVASSERALAIRIRHFGPRHVQVARALVGSATALRSVGKVDSATARCARALEILEALLGPDHALVADALFGMATSAREAGDLSFARELAERALGVRMRVFGEHHAKVAESLHLLGVLERDLGDLASAEIRLARARDLLEAAGPGSRTALADVLSSLGALKRRTDRPQDAQEEFLGSLAIAEEVLGPRHRSVAIALRNLGSLANSAGNCADGEKYFGRALAACGSDSGRSCPDLAPILVGLGNSRKCLGHLPEAVVLYRRALALQVRSLGPDHPALAIGLHNLAGALLESGAWRAALDTALVAEDLTRRQLRLVARGLSEREALHYAATRVRGLDIAFTAALRLKDAATCEHVWDGLVRSRAQVLDEMADRRRAVATASDPAFSRLSTDVATASNKLASLIVRGRGTMDAEAYQHSLASARFEKATADRMLAERSESIRRGRARSEAGLREVAAALPEDAVLVAYVKYTRLETEASSSAGSGAGSAIRAKSGQSSYAALVLANAKGRSHLIDLGPAAPIEARIARWQLEASDGPNRNSQARAEALYLEAGNALRQAVWDSVAAYVGDARRVFVVPDGEINVVNLATLPDAAGGFLLESGPLLHLLSAERDIVQEAQGRATGIGLLVSANPDYDLAAGRAPVRRVAEPSAPRRRGVPCIAFHALSFDSLPATRVEERNIVNLWNRYHSRLPVAPEKGRRKRVNQELVTELLGPAATERAFKRMAPGHNVLHVATHAFTLSGECGGRDAQLEGAVTEEDVQAASVKEQNPLLLCGLALAGANRRSESVDSEDDGILTGEEIASLDLSTVEWAVLSACQTGLGEVTPDEGVFGLRRAFQLAGAHTLIMTLWAVEDQDAALWMDALYVFRLKEARSTADAVRDASLSVLRARRGRGLSAHPFYWGAFVAAGGWN